jgi:hypothetical protein
MAQYRVYTLSEADRVSGPPLIIDCDDDAAAIERAAALVTDRILEVWDGARLVGRLQPSASPPSHG